MTSQPGKKSFRIDDLLSTARPTKVGPDEPLTDVLNLKKPARIPHPTATVESYRHPSLLQESQTVYSTSLRQSTKSPQVLSSGTASVSSSPSSSTPEQTFAESSYPQVPIPVAYQLAYRNARLREPSPFLPNYLSSTVPPARPNPLLGEHVNHPSYLPFPPLSSFATLPPAIRSMATMDHLTRDSITGFRQFTPQAAANEFYASLAFLGSNGSSLPLSTLLTLNTNSNKRKGGQIRFTNYQTTQLERSFRSHKYLNATDRKALATSLGLSDRQVKTWFQNRRAKWRKSRGEPDRNEDQSNSPSRSERSSSPDSEIFDTVHSDE